MAKRQAPQYQVGEAIQAIRWRRHLSQRELAERSGVDASWIWHLEAGHANPTLETVKRLGEALGVTIVDVAEVENHFDHGAPESVLAKPSPFLK